MSAPTWDTVRAAELARRAYRFVAWTMPPDAPLKALNAHEDAALQAQAAGDFDAFGDALRGIMRTALEAKTVRRGAA